MRVNNFVVLLQWGGITTKIEDLVLEMPTENIDEKNWNLEEWRKKYPMDYYKALRILLEANNGDAATEMFNAIYQITRLHVPEVLFKYYSLSDNEKLNGKKFQTLSDGKIFMSTIKDFNDPFDGKGFFYDSKRLEDIERLHVHGGRLIDDFTVFVRGTCFTANGVQSMPMWAHYANNHKGFCVSYNVKEDLELRSSIFPIQYTDERMDVTSLIRKHAELICNKIDENVRRGEKVTLYDDLTIIYMALLLYNVKHVSWSYEKEFRYVVPSNVKGIPYVKAVPREIYIGMKCEERHRKALGDIADYWDIPLYQMGMDECSEKYELFATRIERQ